MKTRTKGTTKTVAQATESAKSVTPKIELAPESTNPPHLFILPKDASPEARIVSIENSRYEEEDRYLICPERGIYEFTRVAAPKTTPRSWLLDPQDEEGGKEDKAKGFVSKAADLYIATQIDPIFILLPALAPRPKSISSESAKKLFLAGDDYLERVTTASPQLSSLVRIEGLRTRLETRMAVVCDTVDAGDETMYRLNEGKLLDELLRKAKKMCASGLPASMEEKLIRKALEVPMLSIKRDQSFLSELVNEEDPVRGHVGITTPAETPDTQNSTSTAATSFSEASTAATSFSENIPTPRITLPPINAPEGVADLLRLRTALFFIFSAYLAPHLTEALKKLLICQSFSVDFAPLDTYLAHLAKLRQEAVAARSLGDYSRKRSMNEDDEGLESRAEKKQKKDEEEKRKKAGESRGVRDLKKVNVSGMKKMSDFFKKKV
ncbi:hypothetical protein D0Z07_3515 [Hyphodiscus hymeniophilus]|uniref:Ribonuclease H2 subunit B n=1 Tax=Hyphodiscus hymeniophilus TaxID=353542 RepID=A0A9P7AY12_9HELO|nr:hypothetical protein D0Z07_3515 [Hyphodiscus hymeniophilus]